MNTWTHVLPIDTIRLHKRIVRSVCKQFAGCSAKQSQCIIHDDDTHTHTKWNEMKYKQNIYGDRAHTFNVQFFHFYRAIEFLIFSIDDEKSASKRLIRNSTRWNEKKQSPLFFVAKTEFMSFPVRSQTIEFPFKTRRIYSIFYCLN